MCWIYLIWSSTTTSYFFDELVMKSEGSEQVVMVMLAVSWFIYVIKFFDGMEASERKQKRWSWNADWACLISVWWWSRMKNEGECEREEVDEVIVFFVF